MTTAKLVCLACGQINRMPSGRLGSAKCGTCGAGLMPGRPVEVDLATLEKAARIDEVALVVDFWAPWCGPCRTMAPEFAKAAGGLAAEARLVKLDTEAHPAAGATWGIRGIPTMIRFVSGRETKRQAGAMQARSIVDWVRR